METVVSENIRLDAAIKDISQIENGLDITWTDSNQSFFHFIWLRDCCYCDQCGDTYSSKRYIVPSDISLDIRPDSVQVDDSGNLSIVWPGNHSSSYASAWLRLNSYDDAARQARFQDGWCDVVVLAECIYGWCDVVVLAECIDGWCHVV